MSGLSASHINVQGNGKCRLLVNKKIPKQARNQLLVNFDSFKTKLSSKISLWESWDNFSDSGSLQVIVNTYFRLNI